MELSSLSSFSFTLFIFHLFHLHYSSVHADDEKFETCSKPFECGSVSNLSYPFYGQSRPDYCGYPGFQLNCSTIPPEISGTSSEQYYITGVKTDLPVVSVARKDYWNGYCPENLHNTSINSTLFSYVYIDETITLYYECSNASTPVTNYFMCSNYSSSSPFGYFVTKDLESTYESQIPRDTCNKTIIIPMTNYESSAQRVRDVLSLTSALRYGFELQWNAETSLCMECRGSGGECGYNSTTSRFTCYCPDKPYASKCPGKSSKKGVAIGLSAGGISLVAVALICSFLIVQRKRRSLSEARSKELVHSNPSLGNPSSNDLRFSQGYTTSPSTYLSHSNSSYPSSKSDFENSADYFGIKVFPFSELEEATENFHESRELGDGGFGTVYYGKLNDGRLVAVKRLYENNCRHMGQFMNEIRILAHLRHKNLVTLYGCTSRRSRELLLVYEYIPNGTVADHLHGKLAQSNVLPWSIRLKIAVETAEALSFLHEKEIVHRDVKTTNILLDNSFQVKVADFGLSRLFPPEVTHVSTAPQGTPGYVDPEYYQCYQLTEKSDVYSFGVVLAELISSKVAVDITRHRHDIKLANMAVDRIQKNALDELIDPKLAFEKDFLAKKIMKSVAEVALQCLQQERDVRPTMKQVLESLRRIQREMTNEQKQVVLDIHESDDVGLLKNVPPPLYPRHN